MSYWQKLDWQILYDSRFKEGEEAQSLKIDQVIQHQRKLSHYFWVVQEHGNG